MKLEDLGPENRQIWLRAFYGFDPEGSGYLGFTHLGGRETMLNEMRSGDLVLIYGAVETLTDQDLRAQALGFLEVELEECEDRERMSDEAYQWKVDRGFEGRWTHGIIVRRAWRIENRVRIASIAPTAYQAKHRFDRTTRAFLLEPDERARALSHPVYQVNVFGESKVMDADLAKGPLGRVLKPAKGLPPSFGQRDSSYNDGENSLYLMFFSANADMLVGRSAGHGKALAKVGRSNDPVRRKDELNCGFPNPIVAGWKLVHAHAYKDGATAHANEDRLKEIFDREFISQGGEFFVGDRKAIEAAFHRFCTSGSPKILGAPEKTMGIR